jgi:hypothetical protein
MAGSTILVAPLRIAHPALALLELLFVLVKHAASQILRAIEAGG